MIPPDVTGLEHFPPENRGAALELGQAMKRLHRHISSRVMRGMQAELMELDLSFSQMTALHELRARESATVTALSERTRLSLPAASHLVERLVQRGLARREENPENRREKLVALTPAGLEVVDGMDSGFARAYVETFAPLRLEAIREATADINRLLDELGPPPCADDKAKPPSSRPSKDTP